MEQGQRSTAAAVTASLAVLLLAAPRPLAAVRALADAGSSTDPTGPVVAAVALLAWAVAGWLGLTVAVVLLSRVPGLLGSTARALAARVAPATVRRTVEAALGLTVAVGALTPTTALAVPAGPAAGPPAAVATAAEPAWDLDWPGTTRPPAPQPVRPRVSAPRPTPTTPSTATTGPSAPSVSAPSVRPAPAGTVSPRSPSAPPPAVRPGASAPTAVASSAEPAAGRPSPAAPTASAVVVRVGDSLWALAEASLRRTGTPHPTDRQVAQEWPRWWVANREAVGDDPDLLLPGTVLRPPAGGPGRP